MTLPTHHSRATRRLDGVVTKDLGGSLTPAIAPAGLRGREGGPEARFGVLDPINKARGDAVEFDSSLCSVVLPTGGQAIPQYNRIAHW